MKTILVWMTIMAAAVGAAAQQAVEERMVASPDGLVEISNISGSVRVQGWDRAEVEVTGTLGRGTERLEFEGRSGRTVVKVIVPRFASNLRGSDLVVRVPAGSRLEVSGVSADIRVDGVAGILELETVSGSIAVAGSPVSVEAKSVSGALELEVAAAPVEAKTVSGPIRILGARGVLSAATVSGGIHGVGEGLDRAEFSTTSGKIVVQGGLNRQGRMTIRSVSGGVDLVLPPDQGTELFVKTFSGGIRHDLKDASEWSSARGPGRELEATLGDGSARITVTSFSGSVTIRTR